MKCELCGSHNVTQQIEQDVIHNQMGSRRILVCRECGFRQNLDECHTEEDLNRKDVTPRQLAQKKAAAYRKIRQERQAYPQPNPAQKGFYQPAPRQNGRKGTSKNASGCIAFIVIAVVLLSVFLSVVSDL